MRNIFDQYIQPENRLTHALMCTLQAERSLIAPFLRWAGCEDIPLVKRIVLTEQQIPGQLGFGEEIDGKGLPDGCFFTDDGWAFLIESKVQSKLQISQLKRHLKTASKRGFDRCSMLTLSVDEQLRKMPEGCVHRSWRELYAWFQGYSKKLHSAKQLVQYMEIFETRMIARDYGIRGTITMFTGIDFDDDRPYNYREGKRLIRLLGDELRKRSELESVGLDLDGEGRTAITGRHAQGVWDFIPLKVARNAANFTDYPHFTIGLRESACIAAITVPNGVRGGFRSRLKELGLGGFVDLLEDIDKSLRPVLNRSQKSRVLAVAQQRFYKSQRSIPRVDAIAKADIRTVVRHNKGDIKYQPQWIEMIYEVLINKRSNIQFALEAEFSPACPIVRSPDVADLMCEAWIAMSPITVLAPVTE